MHLRKIIGLAALITVCLSTIASEQNAPTLSEDRATFIAAASEARLLVRDGFSPSWR